MKKKVIDINCDVGEGIGNEAGLFPYISSCNIACGGHAGDEDSMRKVVRLAKRYKLKIGAHPSYPDKKNFGRTSMELSAGELAGHITEQISSLLSIVREEGAILHHIKPHGELYNDIAVHQAKAMAFIDSIGHYKDRCSVYVPFGSVFAFEAERMGFKFLYEAFGDRRYMEGHTLVPRTLDGAVLEDPGEVLQQVLEIIKKGRVQTRGGSFIPMEAHTFCIHGDTHSALQILVYLSEELPKHGIYLKG